MPSASSKSEKLASSEALDPLKQAIVVVEHKIRNLEKRKTKLDSYKDCVKPLSKDQLEAVSKYDQVVQQLELSRDYVKQFQTISSENEKVKKKNARKEAQERFLLEATKIKQVLLIQEVLKNLDGEDVRQDFLAGQNGASVITETDLKTLNDLYILLTPKCVSEDSEAPKTLDQFQKIGENYMAIIDGKQKELAGMTCSKIRELITSIYSTGYFNKPLKEASPVTETQSLEKRDEEPTFRETQEILSNVMVPSHNPPDLPGTLGNVSQVQNPATLPPVLQGTHNPMMPPGGQATLISGNPSQLIPPNVANIVPTPVSQVESTYFNAQGIKPRQPQTVVPPSQARQINEVILQNASAKFNFLRESELELAEICPTPVVPNASNTVPQIPPQAPSGIPSRTFTNQNFNGQPAGGPTFPPTYPPQSAAYQPFVPAFPAFVGPNTSPTSNNNLSNLNSNINSNTNNMSVNTTTAATSTTIDNMRHNNGNNILSNSNITNATINSLTINKSNNSHSSSIHKSTMPNSIPMTTKNPNIVGSHSLQLTSGLTMQPHAQNSGSQPSHQTNLQSALQSTLQQTHQPSQTFQHVSMPQPNSLCNVPIEETVHAESDKDKKDVHRQDWSQQDNWSTEDWADSEWKPNSQNEGSAMQNKFGPGRAVRNTGPRNPNGYQGNRNRINRQGGYRDQNIQGGSNFYSNQNGYQSRTDRNSDFSGKGNSDLRDNTFKERERDFNNRDNFSGGFRRGPNNRGPNLKGPMDRGDRVGHIQRNNTGGPRAPRNLNRQTNMGSGPSYARQHPSQSGPPK